MKKLLTGILLLFPVVLYAGMRGVISSGSGTAASTTVENFTFLQNGAGAGITATEANVKVPMPMAGTFDDLHVGLGVAIGGSQSYTYAINTNGSSSTLAAVCTGISTTGCTDVVDSTAVVAGDLVDLSIQPSGTPSTITLLRWAVRFTANTSNAYPLLAGDSAVLSLSSTKFLPIQGDINNTGQTSDGAASGAIPDSGTISNLYVKYDVSEVTNSTVTLELNGADTTLTCMVTGGQTTCNDTTHSVSVVIGDSVSWKIQTGTTGSRVGIGAKFSPTVDGESIFIKGNSLVVQNTTNYYYHNANGGGNGTETNKEQLLIAGNIGKLVAIANPASGQTSTFIERIDASSTTVTCQIVGTSTSCVDSVHTASSNDDSVFSLLQLNSVTSGSTNTKVGVVFNAAVAAATSIPMRRLLGVGL